MNDYELPSNFRRDPRPSSLTDTSLSRDYPHNHLAGTVPNYRTYDYDRLPKVDDDSTHEPTYADIAGSSNRGQYDLYVPPRVAEEPVISRRGLLLGAAGVGAVAGLAYFGLKGGWLDTIASRPTQRGGSVAPNPYPERDYGHHTVTTTIFGIGEGPRKSNGNRKMVESAWIDGKDPETGMPMVVAKFGGVDNPFNRNKKGLPVGFRPLHNPYYAGIPMDEFDGSNVLPGVREQSPWALEAADLSADQSLIKGRQILVRRAGRTAVLQWYDTGIINSGKPAYEEYVFSTTDTKQPRKKVQLKISPAAAHWLGFDVSDGNQRVEWNFVSPDDAPDGPWNDYTPVDSMTYWQ